MLENSEVRQSTRTNPNLYVGNKQHTKRPFKDYIKQVHKGERYIVPLSDVGGRVITVKSKDSLELDSMDNWVTFNLNESDLNQCNKGLIKDIQLIPNSTSILIEIPTELIYAKDYKWFSLLNTLNERASEGGLSVLVVRTDIETAVRCSDALIHRVDTVLNKRLHTYNVVKDVVKVKRNTSRNVGDRCRLAS